MISMTKGFLPWILYSIFYGTNPLQFYISLGVAIVSSLLLNWQDYKDGFILSWTTLIYFLTLIAVNYLFHPLWVQRNMWLISNLILAFMAFTSFLLKQPFTAQYAKRFVVRDYWNTKMFTQINNILCNIWGGIFLLTAVIHYLSIKKLLPSSGFTYIILTNIGWLIGAYISKEFPKSWKKRQCS